MLSKNTLYVAGAGCGKTRKLINITQENPDKRILLVTFTVENEAEIKGRFIHRDGFIPSNIKIMTWYKFLLEHCIKPFQGRIIKNKITGINFVNGRTQPRKGINDNMGKFYLNKDGEVFTDRLSQLWLKIEQLSKGKTIERLSRIFDLILVDEVQDMAGYDFEFFEKICYSKISLIMVGDPRQATYSTNQNAKHSKHKRKIIDYFSENNTEFNIKIDNETLSRNHRCDSTICSYSNKLYPKYPIVSGVNDYVGEHIGMYIVHSNDIGKYLNTYKNVVQLRYRSSVKVFNEKNNPVFTFGKVKGREFERVIIYLTEETKNWIAKKGDISSDMTRAKFYVAITRAKYSVAFVYDYKPNEDFAEISIWK